MKIKVMKKILVGLDLSKFDQHVISYTKFINSILKPEEIHFVHIQKDLNLPESVLERFPALMEKIESTFIEEMVVEADNQIIPGVNVKYDVYQGKPFQGLLEQVNNEKTELLIVGKKDDENSTEKKLARKISTNLLFVPPVKKRRLKNILVPIDFSEHSKKSLQLAVSIAKNTNAEIHCQHVYEVPIGYNKTGKTYEEFAEILKGHAQADFDELYEKIDFQGVKVHKGIISLNNYKKIGSKVIEKAGEIDADLIILGARGRTALASILLGSVAEQIVTGPLDCPLLLTKKDPQHLMNFWDTINHL